MHGRDGQFAIAVFDACFLKGSFGHALRGLTVVHEEGREAKAMLARNDSHGFFSALSDLVITGPTRTNVNDYRAILVL